MLYNYYFFYSKTYAFCLTSSGNKGSSQKIVGEGQTSHSSIFTGKGIIGPLKLTAEENRDPFTWVLTLSLQKIMTIMLFNTSKFKNQTSLEHTRNDRHILQFL